MGNNDRIIAKLFKIVDKIHKKQFKPPKIKENDFKILFTIEDRFEDVPVFFRPKFCHQLL